MNRPLLTRSLARRLAVLVPMLFLATPLFVATPRRAAAGSGDGWEPGTVLVSYRKTGTSSHAIAQLKLDGTLIRTFGADSADNSRAHLALSGGYLFRTNGPVTDTIDQFDADGSLLTTITPDSSTTHEVYPICRDFADASIYLCDLFAGTNNVLHLDASDGSTSLFTSVNYSGFANVADLDFGGPAGSEALFAFCTTSPDPIFTYNTNRLAKIDSSGNVTFCDSADFATPYTIDTGSVAVDDNDGSIYVATTTKIVRLDASGTQTGTFSVTPAKLSLDVDYAGNLYVGRYPGVGSAGDVLVYSPTGTLLSTISVPDADRISDVLVVPGEPIPDNQPPVAHAGSDQTVECTGATTSVTLDGSGSTDPDQDTLTYSWRNASNQEIATTASPTVELGLGTHTLTLTVSDGTESDSDTVDVTVEDTTAPTITVSLTPDTLWSPDHKLVDVTATVTAADECDAAPSVELVSITSDEADDGLGSGDTANDIQGASYDTDDRAFQVRAERQGGGDGRVYTVTYRVTDADGNSATATATVTVPHGRN